MTATKIIRRNIKGDWMVDGYLNGRDTMMIEIHPDGTLHDPWCTYFDEVYLRQYGNDCPIITNGCWTFAPDESEIERCGLVPTQMIPA